MYLNNIGGGSAYWKKSIELETTPLLSVMCEYVIIQWNVMYTNTLSPKVSSRSLSLAYILFMWVCIHPPGNSEYIDTAVECNFQRWNRFRGISLIKWKQIAINAFQSMFYVNALYKLNLYYNFLKWNVLNLIDYLWSTSQNAVWDKHF